MKRYAIIRNARSRREVEAYLPDNYRVIWIANESGFKRPVFVIEGRDVAGWTLEGYVLPRLASGLIVGEEIDLTHPIMDEIPA